MMRRILHNKLWVMVGLYFSLAFSALAEEQDADLDTLFAQLAAATGQEKIATIEDQILDLWRDPKSDSIDLLMNRAIFAEGSHDYDVALVHLNAVVDFAPDYAEGWNRRAALHMRMENYDQAVLDIQRTVNLEPRHFKAWRVLGDIFLDMGNQGAALKAFRAALSANPHLEELAEQVKELELTVEGQGI